MGPQAVTHDDAEAAGVAVEYSFALQYNGPPLDYAIPRAVPINVSRIPVAAVLSPPFVSGMLSLPVVQPISAPESKKVSADDKVGPEITVPPTSVIAFEDVEQQRGDNVLELQSDASPDSVRGYEVRSLGGDGCAVYCESGSSGAVEFSGGFSESNELSDAVENSKELVSSSVSHELSRAGSLGTVQYSDNVDASRELSGSSSTARDSSSCKENIAFSVLSPVDWASRATSASLDYPSSIVSPHGEGDCDGEARPPVVTFSDAKFDDAFTRELLEDCTAVSTKKVPAPKVRKGACYRCLKGNRFTEKEVCIVCDTKYCGNCVLRAMGSMPEGRKCVTCIGSPIDESKRKNLGKRCRLLKRLLNGLEVRHIMKTEKLCEANQLRPEHICVNGKPLTHDELVSLHSCPAPPKKLVPGRYWYDKVSGLWGKEGQKPTRIVTPYLNVGGPIQMNASNGTTQVFINGREITKVELRMLQLAGVQCVGNPHFWVNEDGSYLEEGQKNPKGYIWGKAGTKLVCALLSLPVPSKSSFSADQVGNLGNTSFPDYIEQRIIQKLLLVGYNESGTSTIFKQAKILFKSVPFSSDECESIKGKIQSNMFRYLGVLLEGRERFEDECLTRVRERDGAGSSVENDDKTMYSIVPRLKAFSDWLLKTMVTGSMDAIFPAASREYAPLVEELWNDPAIQATFHRRSELEALPVNAKYFLERAGDVLRTDYEPSEDDILYAEGVTFSNGLGCIDFSFQPERNYDHDAVDQHDSLLKFQLIHAKGLGENRKWLEMFEDVRVVVFCVSLADYDQYSVDGNNVLTNKMIQSRSLFESIVTHPTFEHTDFLLVLNKLDLFEKKILDTPLTRCEWFNDFRPIISTNQSNNSRSSKNESTHAELGFYYIAVKFKRLFTSLSGRNLFVAPPVKGLNRYSVKDALEYAREIVKWDEEKHSFGFRLSEQSMYNVDATSSFF
uniref:Extra-large guanine nucleotide-binding protein 1 n=1 Tax=Kalanchoe fedtschenkoi TaxID=63787 RepID=A0A7N0UKS7_KALFE